MNIIIVECLCNFAFLCFSLAFFGHIRGIMKEVAICSLVMVAEPG